MSLHCYACGELLSFVFDGRSLTVKIHFSRGEIRPCRTSWRTPREQTYPFAEIELTS